MVSILARLLITELNSLECLEIDESTTVGCYLVNENGWVSFNIRYIRLLTTELASLSI